MIEKALDGLSSQAASAQQQPEKKEGESKDDSEDKGKAKELPKWTGIVTTKSAKSQALFAMKALIAHQPIPVARMQMKLRITCPTSVLKQAAKSAPKAQPSGDEKTSAGTVKDAILSLMENVESQDTVGAEWEAVGLVEPGAFKALNELIEGQTKGRGNVEVLEMAVGADD
jgi:ribosome maturation protein SDO1